MKPVLVRRMEAAEAARARFHGKSYKPGVRDCPKLALHVLRKLGVSVPFAKGLKWRDEADGLKSLRALGFANLIEAMDSLGLARIAPAQAIVGDIVALKTSHDVGALALCMGNRCFLAFTDASPNAEILTSVTEFAEDDLGPIAWRVIEPR